MSLRLRVTLPPAVPVRRSPANASEPSSETPTQALSWDFTVPRVDSRGVELKPSSTRLAHDSGHRTATRSLRPSAALRVGI